MHDMPCTIEIEHTSKCLHAYVTLEGALRSGPGDKVIVHGAPTASCPSASAAPSSARATVIHAAPLERLRTRVTVISRIH